VQTSAHSERPALTDVLGATLRARRETAGLGLRAAAERAGISPAHLSEVERGLKELSLGRLEALCGALGVAPGEVFLDLAIALGAAPPRPARRPLGFAPDPRDELDWVRTRLPDADLRAVAAFGTYLAFRQEKGGSPP
jgi:transcriptional regulator with XRE-family HTH domain